MSDPSLIPPEIAPIIQAYADGIKPAFSFILISAVFSAMLIPLAILLLLLSTKQSRGQPIFVLNVLNVSLGIIVAVLSNHLTITSIISPLSGINATEDLVYNILYVWLPWVTEAVLIFRVIIVYRHTTWLRLAQILAFPIIIKTARAVIIIIFLVVWKEGTFTGGKVNQFDTTKALKLWMSPTSWILELIDNLYISGLFLFRLATAGNVFTPSKIGRETGGKCSTGSKMRTLFWIAATNLIFPLILNTATIIVYFAASDILLAASIDMANVYISIIATAFATIWASTKSFGDTYINDSGPTGDNQLSLMVFKRDPERKLNLGNESTQATTNTNESSLNDNKPPAEW